MKCSLTRVRRCIFFCVSGRAGVIGTHAKDWLGRKRTKTDRNGLERRTNAGCAVNSPCSLFFFPPTPSILSIPCIPRTRAEMLFSPGCVMKSTPLLTIVFRCFSFESVLFRSCLKKLKELVYKFFSRISLKKMQKETRIDLHLFRTCCIFNPV